MRADTTRDQAACIACRANRLELVPPGGVIYEGDGWRVEHMLAPAVVAGWLIVKPLRHVESLASLSPTEAAALGPLLQRVTAALEAATGVDRVYVALFAEAVRHVHFHVIPGGNEADPAGRGPAVFGLPPGASDTACGRIARNVADRLRAHRDTPA